jgi:hypothetical protein
LIIIIIIRKPVYYTKEHQNGSITLSFSYKKSSYSEPILSVIPLLKPALKFVSENKKITIYEKKFGPSGSGSSGKEGTYEPYQINESFVKEKLSNFFKSLFDKEWHLADFE